MFREDPNLRLLITDSRLLVELRFPPSYSIRTVAVEPPVARNVWLGLHPVYPVDYSASVNAIRIHKMILGKRLKSDTKLIGYTGQNTDIIIVNSLPRGTFFLAKRTDRHHAQRPPILFYKTC